MSIDEYLHRFDHSRRITLVGPMPLQPSEAAAHSDNSQEPVIWVDGGANHRRQGAERMGYSVGDGDSFCGQLDHYLHTDKDQSDLAFVLERLPAHFVEVILLGFLGARRDHELFNLGEVHHFLRAAKQPTRARFEHGVYAYSRGEWVFECHGVFSLAVLEPTKITLVGACKFQLTTPTKIAPLSSLGLSNRGFGTITLNTRAPAFVLKPQARQSDDRPV